MRRGECNVVSLYVLCCPVNGSVCFVCCVFDGVCELFGETIRNMFMELLCVVGGALLARTCVVFHRMCVFACGPSERLDAPSICVVCVFVCRK